MEIAEITPARALGDRDFLHGGGCANVRIRSTRIAAASAFGSSRQ